MAVILVPIRSTPNVVPIISCITNHSCTGVDAKKTRREFKLGWSACEFWQNKMTFAVLALRRAEYPKLLYGKVI